MDVIPSIELVVSLVVFVVSLVVTVLPDDEVKAYLAYLKANSRGTALWETLGLLIVVCFLCWVSIFAPSDLSTVAIYAKVFTPPFFFVSLLKLLSIRYHRPRHLTALGRAMEKRNEQLKKEKEDVQSALTTTTPGTQDYNDLVARQEELKKELHNSELLDAVAHTQ